ncbi:MAG: potassium transporter TrkG, partial [Chloroflexota bacterium]
TRHIGTLLYHKITSIRLDGPWVLILGFALIILIGAALLKLPWSAAPNVTITWEEAFFTATSATTVTGLAVRNTANDFSRFGQVIILLLLQLGGVGFIALSVLLFRIIGRRVRLGTRFIVQQSLGTNHASGVLQLALYVLGVTLILEGTGALMLWLRWRTVLPGGEALWYAIFHSISSYCNAGFDLFGGSSYDTLFGFGTDWFTLAIMGGLITLGSFGITVMYDLWSYRSDHILGLNTRFTLLLTAILTVIGFIVIMLDRRLYQDIMPDSTFWEQSVVGLFTIISTRTAGLTIIDLEQLNDATQMIIMMWMFIGGAPASMAGGVSISTIAVLLMAVIATARGNDEAVVFQRTLPTETIAKAVAIMTVSLLVVILVTFIIDTHHERDIYRVVFEVISAFSNTGYSLNFTSELTSLDRYLIIFTMFWGRLGPLTIVVALAQSEHPHLIRYPEEPVMLG